jgi:hypothetical protein
MIIDGREEKPFDFINLFMPVFSKDSRRYAYAAGFNLGSDHSITHVIADGKTIVDNMTGIAWLDFSPDSRHVVCAGADDGWTPMIDGKSPDWRGGVGRFHYSPDSRHLAFTSGMTDWNSDEESNNHQWWVVIDGQPGPGYDLVLDPSHGQWITSTMGDTGKARFPSDTLTYWYELYRNRQLQWRLIVDFGETIPFSWQRPPAYQGIFFDAPDRLHYLAIKDKGIYLVEEQLSKE